LVIRYVKNFAVSASSYLTDCPYVEHDSRNERSGFSEDKFEETMEH